MLQSLYDAKPFTTYWYYSNASNHQCDSCKICTYHYLMRYRIYMGIRFPIFPTCTTYYIVCSNCGKMNRIETEGEIAKHITKIKNHPPYKYNKYSQLDLEGYENDEILVFGTDKELKQNIKIHMRDIKKSENNT